MSLEYPKAALFQGIPWLLAISGGTYHLACPFPEDGTISATRHTDLASKGAESMLREYALMAN